MAEDKPRQPAY